MEIFKAISTLIFLKWLLYHYPLWALVWGKWWAHIQPSQTRPLKTGLLLSHLSCALTSLLRKISVKTTKIIVYISIMKLFRYFVWSNSLLRHVSMQQLKEITTEHKTAGVTNYTRLETMTKMCHLSVSYTRALAGQPAMQEFKACGRSSDFMKSKQMRSIAMGRITSYSIKFKAGYCQETCKAVGVCTQIILEIPWNQTKDSIGKADGGLKHSLINCCQLPELSRASKLCVPQAGLWHQASPLILFFSGCSHVFQQLKSF